MITLPSPLFMYIACNCIKLPFTFNHLLAGSLQAHVHVVAHYLLLYLGSGGGYIVFSLGGVLLQSCCILLSLVVFQNRDI